MAYWLADSRKGQATDWIQRFDPRFWTVNFPRPMMAAVTTIAPDAMRVDCVFYRKDDLAGLIWESADSLDHPLTAYETDCDYSHLELSFRWRSGGIMALDQVHGPTLTIEGRDADGIARSWYVRLWNYATGSPTDARIDLAFSSLDGGFLLPGEADAVHPADIDRMFISLVAPGYDPAGGDLTEAIEGWAEISDIRADGEGAMLTIGDVVVPPHGIGMCTAFDDCGTQTPIRLVRNLLALGYRGEVIHYLGMSHYFQLVASGNETYVVDPAQPAFNVAAGRWHASFLEHCAAHDLQPIVSLSYELLAMHCPQDWAQRDLDGNPSLTGWDPPSNLLSPAKADAMDYLGKVAEAAVSLVIDANLPVRFQIGEPWWWTFPDGRICLYDDAAIAAFGGQPPAIANLADPLDQAQTDLLDHAGAILAQSTADLTGRVRTAAMPSSAEVRLLAFMPTIFDPAYAEARRANLPVDWASPAFDRLQIEDYDWLTAGKGALRDEAYAEVNQRLRYPIADQDYLSGFVLDPDDAERFWAHIDAGLDEARERGVPQSFVWASPQIMRDGYVRLPLTEDQEDMQAFDDILYPLALGRGTAVMPEFSTNIVITASGHERRNSEWSDARLRFDVGPGIRSEDELGVLLAFFRARRGAARGFRLRDPNDYSSNGMTGTASAFDQLLGIGDGTQTDFPLIKHYGDSVDAQKRRITRPRIETVMVSVDGFEVEDWTMEDKGVLRLGSPPPAGAPVRAGFHFDVPTRFAEDRLEISNAGFAAGEAPSVPLIELREAE